MHRTHLHSIYFATINLKLMEFIQQLTTTLTNYLNYKYISGLK